MGRLRAGARILFITASRVARGGFLTYLAEHFYPCFRSNTSSQSSIRPFSESVDTINLLNHSALASQVPDETAACRAAAAQGSVSFKASSTRSRKSSRLRAILSTSFIGSYSGNGEITTGNPVARYSRTLIADP